MASPSLVLVFLLFTSLTSNSEQSEVLLEDQCSSVHSSPVTVSLVSHRNATGHWLSQLDIENGGDRRRSSDKKETSAWKVAVDQRSVSCGGIESALHTAVLFTVPPPAHAPGYELFPGVGYYKFHSSVVNWTQARLKCAEEGAHLVIINSETEAEAMKALYAKYPKLASNWAWVGLYERTLNEYVSIFGDSFEATGFTRWVPSQPNDAGLDDCVVFRKQTGGLEDTPCKNGFHFVCEQEIW